MIRKKIFKLVLNLYVIAFEGLSNLVKNVIIIDKM